MCKVELTMNLSRMSDSDQDMQLIGHTNVATFAH